MLIAKQPFGKVYNADLRLLEIISGSEQFSLRWRDDGLLMLVSRSGRFVTIAHHTIGLGPDRITTEDFPPPSLALPVDGWHFKNGEMIIPFTGRLAIDNSKFVALKNLPVLRDYPGHMKLALRRFLRKTDDGLSQRLSDLMKSLKNRTTEALELPLIRVIGYGPGPFHPGDVALSGMLMAGRCFVDCQKLRMEWLGRLGVEIRRLMHRTSPFSRACLLYSLEGRADEKQHKLFEAMSRDFEGANDLAAKEIAGGGFTDGKAFLSGVSAILECIGREFYDESY